MGTVSLPEAPLGLMLVCGGCWAQKADLGTGEMCLQPSAFRSKSQGPPQRELPSSRAAFSVS